MNIAEQPLGECKKCGKLAMLFYRIAPSGVKRMICLITLTKQIVINRFHHSFDETIIDAMNEALNLTHTGPASLVLLSKIKSFDATAETADEEAFTKLIELTRYREILSTAKAMVLSMPIWYRYADIDVMADDLTRCVIIIRRKLSI